MSFLKKLLDSEFKELKRFDKMADEILALDEQMSKLKNIDFKNKTEEFKERLKNNENLDDILIEAMALAREACYRGIGEKPFKVQVIGALAIH